MHLLVTVVVFQTWLATAVEGASSSEGYYASYLGSPVDADPAYSYAMVSTPDYHYQAYAPDYYPPPDVPQDGYKYAPSFREVGYPQEYYDNGPEEYPQEDFRNSFYPKTYLQPPRYDDPNLPSYSNSDLPIEETYASGRPLVEQILSSSSKGESWRGIVNPVFKDHFYDPSLSSHPKRPPYQAPPRYSPASTPPILSSTPNIIRGEASPTAPPATLYPETVPSPSAIPPVYPTPGTNLASPTSFYPDAVPSLSPIPPVYPAPGTNLTPPTPIPVPDTVFPSSRGYPDDGFGRPPFLPPVLSPERAPTQPNLVYEAPGHTYPRRR